MDLLAKQDIYIRFLAKSATQNPPPLSFFRKMIMEKDGEYKDRFDIKKRAIAPLAEIARVLALDDLFLKTSSTIQRLKFMQSNDPGNAIMYSDAVDLYLFLLNTKMTFALRNGDSGRYIDPSQLTELEKMKLRRGFKAIQKMLDLIERKYKLGFI